MVAEVSSDYPTTPSALRTLPSHALTSAISLVWLAIRYSTFPSTLQ